MAESIVAAKSYGDMSLEELRHEHQALRDEMLENDAQLAQRRIRPSDGSGLQPIPNYNEWRGEIVARQNEIRADLQYVKGLIAEKAREEYRQRVNGSQVRWKRRALYLRDVLSEIEADDTASPTILATLRRARLTFQEMALAESEGES